MTNGGIGGRTRLRRVTNPGGKRAVQSYSSTTEAVPGMATGPDCKSGLCGFKSRPPLQDYIAASRKGWRVRKEMVSSRAAAGLPAPSSSLPA